MYHHDLNSLSRDTLIDMLQESLIQKESLTHLLDSINAIRWEFDLHHNRFTYISPAAKRILGYELEEWTDFSSWSKMRHPEDQNLSTPDSLSQTEDEKGHYLEYRLLTKSGEILWVMDIVSFGKNETGEVTKLLGFIIDITQKKKAELKAQKDRKFLQTVLDSNPNPMMIINADYSVTFVNKAVNTKGLVFMDKDAPKCYEISHHRQTPCDGKEHKCPLKTVLESKKETKVIHNHSNKDGSDNFFELAASPIFDEENNCTGIIETSFNITSHIKQKNQLETTNKELDHNANHDFLTGLPNRALFMDRLEQTIKESKRDNRKFALFFMDLDHFKEINDTHGHDIGDAVLKEVSFRFSSSIRESDTLSRLGGDEFTLIMKNVLEQEDIKTLAKKLVHAINEPMFIDTLCLNISTSIGICIFPNNTQSPKEMLLYSDSAMYAAKKEGKNSFMFYNNQAPQS